MTTDPTDLRGELAAGMVHVATRLAGHVRDWNQNAVDDLLGRLNAPQQRALCVVLAAMVDIDQTPTDLLAWTDPTTTTGPAPGGREDGAQSRTGPPHDQPNPSDEPVFDGGLVERAANGENVKLHTRAEKHAAAKLILDAGHPYSRIADRLGVSGTTARKLAVQARQETT